MWQNLSINIVYLTTHTRENAVHILKGLLYTSIALYNHYMYLHYMLCKYTMCCGADVLVLKHILRVEEYDIYNTPCVLEHVWCKHAVS